MIYRTPAPAGARKSIFHPDETDIKVLDAMIGFDGDKLQLGYIVEQTGIDKPLVQKSIKWLAQSGKIITVGKGRGTSYKVNVEENDLVPVDPTQFGDQFRPQGGPTVREIVRAVFNRVEPMTRLAPSKVIEIAMSAFPEKKLNHNSFGQVFSKMATAGEIQPEGEGRNRKYWRGLNMIEGAATISSDVDFSRFFETISNDEDTSDNSEESFSIDIAV